MQDSGAGDILYNAGLLVSLAFSVKCHGVGTGHVLSGRTLLTTWWQVSLLGIATEVKKVFGRSVSTF